jgi:transposase-like protein
VGKPRRFSPEFKASVMLEIVSGRKSLAQVSREHQIKDTVLHRWKTQFLEGLPEIFAPGQPAEQKRLRDRIAELERLAGKQALQLEIAKKASQYLASLPPENER